MEMSEKTHMRNVHDVQLSTCNVNLFWDNISHSEENFYIIIIE